MLRMYLFLIVTLIVGCSASTEENIPDVTKIEVDPKIDYTNIKDSTEHHLKALFLIQGKDYAKALEHLYLEFTKNPHHADVIDLIGMCLSEIGRSEEALNYLDKCIEMNSKESTYFYNRGLAHSRLDNHVKSIADYSKAIELEPNHNLAYYNRALVNEKLRLFELAILDYDLTIKINGDEAKTYNNRGRCYMILNKYDEAISDFNKALEIEPKKANTYCNRGITYYKMGKNLLACNDFEVAAELGFDVKMYIDKVGCK